MKKVTATVIALLLIIIPLDAMRLRVYPLLQLPLSQLGRTLLDGRGHTLNQ